MDANIAFIIIGKNEGIKIEKCLSSVFNAISKNQLNTYEVIYVDSNSTDDSLSYALKFNNVKIIKLTGEVNAAVARNEGAKAVDKKILFFIDGDMEINSDFLPLAIYEPSVLKHEFISGDFISIDKTSGMESNKIKYHDLKDDAFMVTTGGIFIIYKEFWDRLNGMKPKFRRSQDIDFGLRMSQNGIKLLRLKEIIAYHNTVFYHSKKRLWKDLFNHNQLYQKSVMYRDHILNPFIYHFLLREITLFALIFSIILISIIGNPFFITVFFGAHLVKVIYKKNNLVEPNSLLSSIMYYVILDIFVLLGLFIFWPSNRKKYHVETIKRY